MVWNHWDDSIPIITPIRGHLLLGNAAAARDRTILEYYGVKRILSVMNLTDYLPSADLCDSLHIQHAIFPIADESFPYLTADVLKQKLIEVIFPWIKESEDEQKTVLIHCFASRSRSTSLVITYLIWNDGAKFEQILNRLYEIHPLTNPMPGTLQSFLESIGKRLPEWYEEKWEERWQQR